MSNNYRTDARTVRAAAQAKLSELRAKRRANRAPDHHNKVTDEVEVSAAEQFAEAEQVLPEAAETVAALEIPEPSEPKAEVEKPSKKRKTQTRKREPLEPSQSHPEAAAPTAGALQVSAFAEHLSNAIEDETVQEHEEAEVAAEEPAEILPPKPMKHKRAARKTSESEESETISEKGVTPETRSDLYALPGVGSGLVDLLQTCGVNSLSDLARADTGSLRRDMGLPGELLNLDSWVAEAARRVE